MKGHLGAGDRLAQLGGHPGLLLLGSLGEEDRKLFQRPDHGAGRSQISGFDPFPGVLEQGPGMTGLAESDDPRRALDGVGIPDQIGDGLRRELLQGKLAGPGGQTARPIDHLTVVDLDQFGRQRSVHLPLFSLGFAG